MLVYYLGAKEIPDLSSEKGLVFLIAFVFIVCANFVLIFAKHMIIFNRISLYRASLDSFLIVKNNFRQIVNFLLVIVIVQFYLLFLFVPLQAISNLWINIISIFVDGARFYIITSMITLFYLDLLTDDRVDVSV